VSGAGGFPAKRAAAADKVQDVRGYLASKLHCWHRLTGEESDQLVALFEGQAVQRQPLTRQQCLQLAVHPLMTIEQVVRVVEAAHGIGPKQ